MCHVLIIEDEALVAFDLQDILAARGASSFAFAASEQEAVEQARRARPEFITSDVRLFDGTGPNAVKAILHEHGPIPVVYVTASPEECDGCPPECVLAKPVVEEKLVRLFLRSASHLN